MHVEYNKCDLSVKKCLTLSWRRPLSYRSQSIDLRSESIDYSLYDNGLRHERVNAILRVWICYREFYDWNEMNHITQIIKFSIKDFFSKCDQIPSFLRILSHLLKKSIMENFVFCAVLFTDYHYWQVPYAKFIITG